MSRQPHSIAYSRLCLLLLVCFLSWLAWSFGTIAIQTKSTSMTKLGSVFSLSGIQNQRHLDQQVAVLKHTLKNTYWREDRQQYTAKLLILNQQRLRKKPYDGWLWHSVLEQQYQLSESKNQIIWSLDQSLKWNSWYDKLRPSLSFYCFYYWSDLPDSVLASCARTIKQLATNPNYQRQHELSGLDQSYIQNIVEQVLTSGLEKP